MRISDWSSDVCSSDLTTRYDIDLFKCIFCGFCEESCPVDSIVETHVLEYHFENRGENIVNTQQLLAIGDRPETEIAARRAADAAFRAGPPGLDTACLPRFCRLDRGRGRRVAQRAPPGVCGAFAGSCTCILTLSDGNQSVIG